MAFQFSQAKPEDSAQVCAMIEKVFGEFVAPGYRQEGVDAFLNYAAPREMAARLEKGPDFGFVMRDGDRVAGYIEMRDNGHVSLMFVDSDYHRQGICRKLFDRAGSECMTRKPELKSITVNSSPFAVKVYERLGFSVVDEEREQDGIRFVPMEKMII